MLPCPSLPVAARRCPPLPVPARPWPVIDACVRHDGGLSGVERSLALGTELAVVKFAQLLPDFPVEEAVKDGHEEALAATSAGLRQIDLSFIYLFLYT